MIPSLRADRKDLRTLAAAVAEIQSILDHKISIGYPGAPYPDNLRGVWLEETITALDTAFQFSHNMSIPFVSATGSPNVRWPFVCFQHDGNGVVAGDETITLLYEIGDAIDADSIELRLYATGARVVDGTHPVTVSVFFTPAVN